MGWTFPWVSSGRNDFNYDFGVSIEGLEHLMDGLDATATIRLLNELVDSFDDAAERHGVEKVRTVGDAYLAACGLSTPRLDHRQRMAKFANELVALVDRFNTTKGYGFIQPEGGTKDVFVHISAVQRSGMNGLAEGQRVSFDVVTERGKQAAANLKAV